MHFWQERSLLKAISHYYTTELWLSGERLSMLKWHGPPPYQSYSGLLQKQHGAYHHELTAGFTPQPKWIFANACKAPRTWEVTSISTFNQAFLTLRSRLSFKGLDSVLISLKIVCPSVFEGSSMGGGDFYPANQAATKQKESHSIIPSKRIKQWKRHTSPLCGIFAIMFIFPTLLICY